MAAETVPRENIWVLFQGKMNRDWKRGTTMKAFMLGGEFPFVFPPDSICRPELEEQWPDKNAAAVL